MNAPQKIIELVEDFKQNKHEYTNPDIFDEENTKVKFLNPFFEELGWNVRNEGLSARFREVVFEDSIKVGKKTKAPDYSFRLGGERIFFVEAKKPSRDIANDKEHAFQVRRYGWSAKLPLCILTDFEELAIYDTTIKPDKNQNASIGRIKYYKYTEYIDKWDEIYNIFSKEAVLSGKFDNYANNVKHDKKGTTEIDDEFLKEIEEWRLLLARNIALRNPELSIEELNLAVQLTIDRIIFLRIAEDRGIERYGQLEKLQTKENIYQEFAKICKKADEKYNSGLFHFNPYDKEDFTTDTYTLKLNIDNTVFKEIFKNLYYPNSPYEFSLISTEILGKIYEQFLGKVIRLTPGHQAKVEDKPEVKKAGGVYYTPQYIVDYIVENTLGKKIKNKTPKQISKIRVIDPACGSGSFLIRAYQYLLDYHIDYYSKLEKPPKDVIYTGKDGLTRLTIQEKKRILKNNIYGVDLDTLAVEVTKLSLLLKVLEDQNKDQLEQQTKLFHERALPNLSSNIKNGNSLINNDILEQQELTIEEIKEIKPFNYEEEYAEIFEQGGFDVVIGNPPYVRQESIKEQKPYYKEHYETYVGTADLYVYFFEKEINILKEKGEIGLICSNKYSKAKYGKKLRTLLTSYNIEKYVDYSKDNVFKGAAVLPSVIILNKSFNENNTIEVDKSFTMKQKDLDNNSWSFDSPEVIKLKQKIHEKGTPIKNIKSIRINRGILTGYNKAFVINEKTKNELIQKDPKNKEIIKPLLRGKDVQNGEITFGNQYLISTKNGINVKKEYPIIFEHLNQFSLNLKKRSDQGEHWTNLRSCSYYDDFDKEKLIYPNIAPKLNPVYDNEKYYTNQKCFILTSDKINLKYLKAVLSSNLINFIFMSIGSPLLGDRFDVNKAFVEQLPVYIPKNNEDNELIELIDKLISLKHNLSTSNTPNERKILQKQIDITDKKINEIVYELYDLTDDEIEIIEENI
ncbi:MAG: N-6 DNA methylase [Methanosphaera sp.]|nr:N-6 DNA methylase [Methanosphaera sp.]